MKALWSILSAGFVSGMLTSCVSCDSQSADKCSSSNYTVTMQIADDAKDYVIKDLTDGSIKFVVDQMAQDYSYLSDTNMADVLFEVKVGRQITAVSKHEHKIGRDTKRDYSLSWEKLHSARMMLTKDKKGLTLSEHGKSGSFQFVSLEDFFNHVGGIVKESRARVAD